MPIYPIRFFPDPVLRTTCSRVESFDVSLQRLMQDLIQTMKSQPYGIGIAAPQIGVPKQVAIVDVSSRISSAKLLVLVNPVILEFLDEKASREGCMSLPDYTGNLKRYERIHLRWWDEKGQIHQKFFDGIEAVCIQHEVDHLNGQLFIDRVVSLKRDLIPRPKVHKKR